MTTPQAAIRGRGTPPVSPAAADAKPGLEIPDGAALVSGIEDSFLRAGEDFLAAFTPDRALRLLPKLLSDADFQVSAAFRENTVVIPDSSFDLRMAEGASMCLGLQSKGGLISAPRPVALRGFAATAWIFAQPLDKVVTDESGKVGVSSPCFDKALQDITAELMSSPLGGLFPAGKVAPFRGDALAAWIRSWLGEKPAPSAAAPGSMQGMMDHLDRVSLGALIYADPRDRPPALASWDGAMCHPSAASLDVLLNVPKLKENIAERAFENFDGKGVEALDIHWPGFPLKEIAAGSGLEWLGGDVTLDARALPEGQGFEVSLQFRKASFRWPKLFGSEAVEWDGGLQIQLLKGGRIAARAKRLHVNFPTLPAERFPLLTLQGTLDGTAEFQKQENGITPLSAELSFSDLAIGVPGVRTWRTTYPDGDWSGAFTGKAALRYDPAHPEINLVPSWEGNGRVDFVPRDSKRVSRISWDISDGKISLPFGRKGGSWFPQISAASVDVGGGIAVRLGTETLAEASGLRFRVAGGDRTENGGEILQHAAASLNVERLDAGQFAWRPEITVLLTSRQRGAEGTLLGQGSWDLDSIEPKKKMADGATIVPPFTDVGMPFSFSTDGNALTWTMEMKRPQTVGPVKVSGDLKVEGQGTAFKLQTIAPLTVMVHGKDIVRGLNVKGNRNDKATSFAFQAASVADVASAAVWVKVIEGEKLAGSYQFRPFSRLLPKTESFGISGVDVTGSFLTPSLEDVLGKPRVFLKGEGRMDLQADWSGPVASAYQATLAYQPALERNTPRGPRVIPASFLLSFGNKSGSRVEVGPLKNAEGVEMLRGSAALKGSLRITPGSSGFSFGGNGIGIRDGRFFFGGGDDPVVDQLIVDAEQLWDIRNGVARGKSLRVQADVNLAPFLGRNAADVDPQALRRRILWIADRQPLSVEAFWNLLQPALEKAPGGGGTP